MTSLFLTDIDIDSNSSFFSVRIEHLKVRFWEMHVICGPKSLPKQKIVHNVKEEQEMQLFSEPQIGLKSLVTAVNSLE